VLLLISICLLMAPSLYHQILFDGESRVAAIRAATWLPGASLLPFTLGLGAAAFVAFERMFGPTAGTLFSLAFILTGLALLYGVGFALPSAAWFPDHRDVDKVVSRASPDAGFFRIGSALVVTASLPFAIGIFADGAVVFFKATQRRITKSPRYMRLPRTMISASPIAGMKTAFHRRIDSWLACANKVTDSEWRRSPQGYLRGLQYFLPSPSQRQTMRSGPVR